MLNDFNCSCPVYIACGYTDLRHGIDGLAGLVQTQFQMDPF
ncbi:MAG: IS66 family insertion sequence element accessory protein TnpB [Oscillospiraceae bacterium]|nr:IS66 family insertion sequence element accessory protein TnpB [Oscillospiraceae bacterium]